VSEPMDEIVDLVVKYRRKVFFSFISGEALAARAEEEEQ